MTPDEIVGSWVKLGYVYVIGARRGGPVKIGYSTNLWGRLRAFQTSYPYQLHILGAFVLDDAGIASEIEEGAHASLVEKRLAGEWFDTDADSAVGCLQLLISSSGRAVRKWDGLAKAQSLTVARMKELAKKAAKPRRIPKR